MKGNIKIRKLTEKNREEYRKLMRYAFETSKNNYENITYPSDKTPMNWHYGAFDNDLLVAGVGNIPFEIRLRSQDFKMYGVGGVASKPEYRNRGIIRDLMLIMFREMHENNIPVSVLYPFKFSFYEALGYKLVDENVFYQFKISDIISKETDYHMKEVERINEDIRIVYDNAILNFDYIAKRPEIDYWRRHFKKNYKFICYNRNQPIGYVILFFPKSFLEFEDFEEYKHPDKTIFIREIFWLDLKAKQTIFNFLWSHRDQRKYLAGDFPTNEIIIDLLKTPRILERKIEDNSMLRIVDVKSVLENLKYPLADFSILFNIHDDFCSWNNGFFTLSSKENEVHVEFSDSSEKIVDLKIDIGYLAQLLVGYRTVKDLLDFGFVSINNEKLDLLNKIFPKTNNFFRDFF